MIKEYEVVQLLVQPYPFLRPNLISQVEDWLRENGSISIYAIMNCLVVSVVDKFVAGEYEGASELFELVEKLIVKGEQSVAEAASTGFIEALQNIASKDGVFKYGHFISLLGQESKKYSVAWDDFSRVENFNH